MPSISLSLKTALDAQIAHELSNAALYRKAAGELTELGIRSLATYYAKQAHDELGHAERLAQHILDRGACEEPRSVPAQGMIAPYGGSAVDAIAAISAAVLDREEDTTSRLQRIAFDSERDGDLLLRDWLSGLILEQIEEEDTARAIARAASRPDCLADILLAIAPIID